MSQIIFSKAAYPHKQEQPYVLANKVRRLDWKGLQKLWVGGKRKEVLQYVKTHYLASQEQIWLIKTKDSALIKTYLRYHPEAGLNLEAEELLMELKDKSCCKAYINNRPLRPYSILMLFAEKEIRILQHHLAKYPDESFSRLALILMFETGNENLIRQYFTLHPSLKQNENYREKLQKIGILD